MPLYLDARDTCVLITSLEKPVWIVNVVGLIGMAWSGVGADDASLSYDQQSEAYFVRYIQTKRTQYAWLNH